MYPTHFLSIPLILVVRYTLLKILFSPTKACFSPQPAMCTARNPVHENQKILFGRHTKHKKFSARRHFSHFLGSLSQLGRMSAPQIFSSPRVRKPEHFYRGINLVAQAVPEIYPARQEICRAFFTLLLSPQFSFASNFSTKNAMNISFGVFIGLFSPLYNMGTLV